MTLSVPLASRCDDLVSWWITSTIALENVGRTRSFDQRLLPTVDFYRPVSKVFLDNYSFIICSPGLKGFFLSNVFLIPWSLRSFSAPGAVLSVLLRDGWSDQRLFHLPPQGHRASRPLSFCALDTRSPIENIWILQDTYEKTPTGVDTQYLMCTFTDVFTQKYLNLTDDTTRQRTSLYICI